MTQLRTATRAARHFFSPTSPWVAAPSPAGLRSGSPDVEALGITYVVDYRVQWTDEDLFSERLPHVADVAPPLPSSGINAGEGRTRPATSCPERLASGNLREVARIIREQRQDGQETPVGPLLPAIIDDED